MQGTLSLLWGKSDGQGSEESVAVIGLIMTEHAEDGM